MQSKIQRELKYLEPNGASRRNLYALPKTFDKAYQEMHLMQQKYNNEREELRIRLNSPIKQGVKDLPLINTIKTSRKLDLTPRLFRKRKMSISNNISPIKIKSPDASTNRLEYINDIMDSCYKLDETIKTSKKKIPGIEKKTEDNLKIVNQIVDAIDYISPSNKVNDYMSFKRQLLDTEHQILSSRDILDSRSVVRIRSHNYLECKLRKKNLWNIKNKL